MAETILHLEIGPLKEGNFTGISQVTAAIAEQMLGDLSRPCEFFFGRALVDREVVEDLIVRRDGELIEWYLRRAPYEPAPADLASCNVALYPNRKTCRRGFHMDVQIIHDLSTLLTPQFHNKDTIEYHANTMLEDVQSNDLTFCVSEATRQDVLRYFSPIDPASVITLHLAASISADVAADFGDRTAEPYVVVLGTIEPRKNIDVVLRYLARNPAVLAKARFLFLGRYGWGEKFDDLLIRYGLAEALAQQRIVFPGFVSEATKNALIRHARLLIYPSLFEGFGIPILEGLALGVPSVTTRSSSLPEVGGSCCTYFDPFLEGDFDVALSRAFLNLRLRGDALPGECRAWAANFSWSATYTRMRNAIDGLLLSRVT